jgi:hypothetical protein
MTRLVIHIGDPKTGTSSIQRTLYEGRYTAAAGRVAWPDAPDAIPLARSLMAGAPPGAAARRFADLARWLAAQEGARVAAISAEHFAFVDPARLVAALEAAAPGLGRRAEVVAYVRPHPGRLLSAWVQQVKTGGTVRAFLPWLATATARGRFRAAPRFAAWAAAFGPRFTLRAMLRDRLVQGDVVADFLALALGDDRIALAPGGRRNESPALVHLAAIRAVQAVLRRAGLDAEMRHSLGAALQDRLAALPGAAALPRPVLPAAALPALRAGHAEDAAAIDAAFFAPDRPLSAALAAATGGDDPLDLTATFAAAFDPAARAGIRAAAAALAALPPARLARWRAAFVARRRARTDAPAPAPRPAAAAVDRPLDAIAAAAATAGAAA